MSKLYLISPENIDIDYLVQQSREIFRKYANIIPLFQLRLKGYDKLIILDYLKKLYPLCRKYNVKLILNDYIDLVSSNYLDGIHIGIKDYNYQNLLDLRRNYPKLIIGTSCYDNKDLAIMSYQAQVNYVSFGAFFKSKTKISIATPPINIIKWWKDNYKLPVSVIGGIDCNNIQKIIKYNPDYVCIISYIWSHPKGVIYAIEQIIKYLV